MHDQRHTAAGGILAFDANVLEPASVPKRTKAGADQGFVVRVAGADVERVEKRLAGHPLKPEDLDLLDLSGRGPDGSAGEQGEGEGNR